MDSDHVNEFQMKCTHDELIELCCQIVTGNQIAHPRKLIQQIIERSKARYKEVKKQKQNEIGDRVDAGQTPGDKKKLKKKVDNNASSVASRARREYYCDQLQELLQDKTFLTIQLAKGVLQREKQVQELSEENNVLTNQLAKVLLQKEEQLGRAQREINILKSQQTYERQTIPIHHNTMMFQQHPSHTDNMIDDFPESLPQHQVERYDIRGIDHISSYNIPDIKQDSNQVDIAMGGNLLEYSGLPPQEMLSAKEKLERDLDHYDIARQETLKNELRPEDHAPSNPVA